VTKKELEEQRVCVNVCCKLGKYFTEIFQLFNQVHASSRSALFVLVGALFKKFGLFF
jgi:hypothetical protein